MWDCSGKYTNRRGIREQRVCVSVLQVTDVRETRAPSLLRAAGSARSRPLSFHAPQTRRDKVKSPIKAHKGPIYIVCRNRTRISWQVWSYAMVDTRTFLDMVGFPWCRRKCWWSSSVRGLETGARRRYKKRDVRSPLNPWFTTCSFSTHANSFT